MLDEAKVECKGCGRERDRRVSSIETLAWMTEHDQGVLQWVCPDCARAHVHEIEGKLPTHYW